MPTMKERACNHPPVDRTQPLTRRHRHGAHCAMPDALSSTGASALGGMGGNRKPALNVYPLAFFYPVSGRPGRGVKNRT